MLAVQLTPHVIISWAQGVKNLQLYMFLNFTRLFFTKTYITFLSSTNIFPVYILLYTE